RRAGTPAMRSAIGSTIDDIEPVIWLAPERPAGHWPAAGRSARRVMLADELFNYAQTAPPTAATRLPVPGMSPPGQSSDIVFIETVWRRVRPCQLEECSQPNKVGSPSEHLLHRERGAARRRGPVLRRPRREPSRQAKRARVDDPGRTE